MELLVVMGAMAILMGLAVGYLTNIGKGSQIAQARRLIVETARRCVNASMGNQRAFFVLRPATEDSDMRLEAGIARTVLTHQFEELTFASGARTPFVEGSVKLAKGEGHTGHGAQFAGGSVKLSPESLFAMTEGLQFEAWIKPQTGASTMGLLRGTSPTNEVVYAIELARSGNTPAYDVRLRLRLRGVNESLRTAGEYKTFETVGAPVAGDGQSWTHVSVDYDGRAATIAVSGVPVALRAADVASIDDKPDTEKRIAIPLSGTVSLAIGGGYRGLMDSLVLRGVFRSKENDVELPGRLEVIRPTLPVRVEYINGRLAGGGGADLTIWFRDLAHPEDMPLRLTLGRAGTVEAKYVDAAPAPATTTTGGTK